MQHRVACVGQAEIGAPSGFGQSLSSRRMASTPTPIVSTTAPAATAASTSLDATPDAHPHSAQVPTWASPSRSPCPRASRTTAGTGKPNADPIVGVPSSPCALPSCSNLLTTACTWWTDVRDKPSRSPSRLQKRAVHRVEVGRSQFLQRNITQRQNVRVECAAIAAQRRSLAFLILEPASHGSTNPRIGIRLGATNVPA